MRGLCPNSIVYAACCVGTIAFHAMGFVCRFHSILTVNPLRNRWWLVSSLCVIAFQVVFAIVSTLDIGRQPISTNDSKWLFLLLWPAGVIVIDEVVKFLAHREYKQKQKKVSLHSFICFHVLSLTGHLCCAQSGPIEF
jgi:hypothetical protein